VATNVAATVQISNAFARGAFSLAAAVTAAALIDPMVEFGANSGFFGPGTFTDHSNLYVAPALITGLALTVAFVMALVRRTFNRSTRYAPDWLRRFPGASGGRSMLRPLPAVFVLQLGALWSLETVEQIVVAGRPLGGTLWLGGPVLTSLLMHAVGCLVVTWLLSRAVRWSVETIVEVVRLVREIFCNATPGPATTRSRAIEVAGSALREPILARLNGRAPPYLIV
jgi:hypothetical protein